MCLIVSLLFLLLLFQRYQDVSMLEKNRADILKALFPFLIILHHISIMNDCAWLADFRYCGAYVVGIFFFMSGYGLEYKKGLGTSNLSKRLSKLFKPVVLPMGGYILYVLLSNDNAWVFMVDTVRHFNLILPYSWFVIVIGMLYSLHSFISKRVLGVINFDVVFALVLFFLCVLFYLLRFDSVTYISNSAFLLGIIYQQKEKSLIQLMRKRFVMLAMLFVLAMIVVSYGKGTPLFAGFSVVGVPLFVLAFFLVFSKIQITHLQIKPILFLKRHSYEMYLWQSLAMIIVGYISVESMLVYVLLTFAIDLFLSFCSRFLLVKIHG